MEFAPDQILAIRSQKHPNEQLVQVERLERLIQRVKRDYTAVAVGLHASARLQLREAGRASNEALAAAETARVGRQVAVHF